MKDNNLSRLILVRHGETEWNRLKRFQGRSDIPLNRNGREQVQKTALKLKDEQFTVAYTSPLKRARETADLVLSHHLSIPLLEEEGLLEMDLGRFEGMTVSEWVEKYPDFRETWLKRPSSLQMPNGESLVAVQERGIKTVKRILNRSPPGSTILICSHNFLIVSLLCYASHLTLDHFREIKLETAGVAIIKASIDLSSISVEL